MFVQRVCENTYVMILFIFLFKTKIPIVQVLYLTCFTLVLFLFPIYASRVLLVQRVSLQNVQRWLLFYVLQKAFNIR